MNTEFKGLLGEYFAIVLLLLKGFRILEHRYKTFCGEIDVIAKKNNLVVFVEVKSRKNQEKCYNAIRQKQLKRIQNASSIFFKRNRKFAECDMRFDVVLVADWKIPIYIENVSM